ncbi:MAG: hypothetical protein VW886_07265, partial [Candidatus Heimdallarchaeota archaeon]
AVGNYTVEIIVEDRALNVAKITTSFSVMLYGNNSTNVSNNGNNTSTISETNTVKNTDTNNETSTETNNQSIAVSIPESTPIADLPFILLVSFIGLYMFRKNRK